MIKRFSGGGTVIVDRNTIFASIIVNQADVPECRPYPREIMDWSMCLYGPAFKGILKKTEVELGLRENDYVFDNLKFGGNAQAITKGRWLHHTSFLWGFDPNNMLYLQLPEKRPQYRGDRDHKAFLTPLEDHIQSKDNIWPALKEAARDRFRVEEASISDVPGFEDSGEDSGGWMERCRTKFVGLDGKPLPVPEGGHPTMTVSSS